MCFQARPSFYCSRNALSMVNPQQSSMACPAPPFPPARHSFTPNPGVGLLGSFPGSASWSTSNLPTTRSDLKRQSYSVCFSLIFLEGKTLPHLSSNDLLHKCYKHFWSDSKKQSGFLFSMILD